MFKIVVKSAQTIIDESKKRRENGLLACSSQVVVGANKESHGAELAETFFPFLLDTLGQPLASHGWL